MTKNCGKTHVIGAVAKKLSVKKTTIEEVYDAIFDVFKRSLSEEYKVILPEIGTLQPIDREERTTRNPVSL